MRVLHVGKFWPPYAGGIERASHDLCHALARAGDEVVVVAHASPRCWRGSRAVEAGVTVELAACWGQLAYTPASPGFCGRLNSAVVHHQPQVLHLHMPNPAAFWALTIPAARRIPWLVHWHSDIPLADAPGAVRALYPVYRPFENALLRRAAAVVTTTPDYRDASTALREVRDKTHVIALGSSPAPAVTDAARRQARRLWPGSGLRLLAVGRLSHYKGFDVLVDAVAKTPDVQLLLIGDGECAAALQDQVRRLGLGGRVRLAGRVDDAVRDAAYAEAELFCLPSVARSEAFGVVLLEAMRAGLPVLASNLAGSGMVHVVDHGKAGAVAEPGDSAAWASMLQSLAARPDRRNALAQAGFERWRRHFSLTASADAWRALYRSIAAS